MTDFVAAGIGAAGHGGVAAFGLTFMAGLVTSIGPCVAPRYIAVAAMAERGRAGWSTAAFVCGLVAAYDMLGFAAGLLGSLFDFSGVIYAALAVAMVTCGAWTLVTARAAHEHVAPAPASTGAAFLLGAGSAFVVSPCCTPIVAAIVASSTAIGRPADGLLLLTTFGLGHAAPLLAAGMIGTHLSEGVRRLSRGQAPAIVAGSLMLALGSYYGALA